MTVCIRTLLPEWWPCSVLCFSVPQAFLLAVVICRLVGLRVTALVCDS